MPRNQGASSENTAGSWLQARVAQRRHYAAKKLLTASPDRSHKRRRITKEAVSLASPSVTAVDFRGLMGTLSGCVWTMRWSVRTVKESPLAIVADPQQVRTCTWKYSLSPSALHPLLVGMFGTEQGVTYRI